MAGEWSGFADRLWGGFDKGLAFGAKKAEDEREAKLKGQDRDYKRSQDAESTARAERQEMATSEQRDFERRKALGFEGSTDPGEAAFRDRMRTKESEEARLRRAQAGYYEDRYRGGPAERGEQAVGAKLKETGSMIDELNEKEKEDGAHWYNPLSWANEGLSSDDAKLRETLRGNRARLLGIGGSSGGGQLSPTQQQAYLAARRAGKPPEEARSIALAAR